MANQEIKRGSIDPAVVEMLEYTREAHLETMWDRYNAQQPQCKFGRQGICCRICIQGPCRIIPSKPGQSKGICGADAYTIVARNMARYMAGGASAHSDHGREMAFTLLGVAQGHTHDYKITDQKKLISYRR
jgi:anaerobic carbon-monoxide dehydrogenase catalytic subunit